MPSLQTQTQSHTHAHTHTQKCMHSNINAFKNKLDEINVEELVQKGSLYNLKEIAVPFTPTARYNSQQAVFVHYSTVFRTRTTCACIWTNDISLKCATSFSKPCKQGCLHSVVLPTTKKSSNIYPHYYLSKTYDITCLLASNWLLVCYILKKQQ